jgi:hypothetical protein
VRVLLVAVLLLACGASAKQQQTPYTRIETLMPKVLAALTELGESMQKVKGDCPQLAKVLRRFADQHAALLPELTDLMGKLSDQERQRFELEHHDDRARLSKLFGAINVCSGNAEVEAAFVTAGFSRMN